LLLSLPAAVGAARASVPFGSFLTKPVSSVNELAALTRKDRVLASRFSRHFGMQGSAIADYFEKNLTISALPRSGRYTVYYVTPSGRIVVHRKYLKAGTKVFVAFNGQPILDVKCGNPMSKYLPKPIAQAKPPVKVAEAPEPVPVTTALVQPPEVKPAEPVAPEPVKMEVLAEPPAELPPVAPVATKGASWLIPGLLGVGAVGAISGGGGGEEVIPEPTGFFALSMGMLSLLAYASRRSRQRATHKKQERSDEK
jgi:hypothetical protein